MTQKSAAPKQEKKVKADKLERENHMREIIKRAAFNLMAEKGIEKVSMREIAEKVHVTKPVLYYYFKNKEDLCESIIHETIESFNEKLRLSCCDKNLTIAEILKIVFVEYLKFFEKDPKNSQFIIRTMSYAMDSSGNRRRNRKEPPDRLAEGLRYAVERGEMPEKGWMDAGRLVTAMFSQLMLSAYMHTLMKDKRVNDRFHFNKETVERLADIILLGINKYYEEPKK